MEPAAIDWKNVESKFVRDELYEHFKAPKWVDFSISDGDNNDDKAWFCRPDCRHPKTAEDFLQISATPPNLKVRDLRNHQRDENLKRRGVLLPLSSSPSSRSKPASTKNKFNEDLENQNPNLTVLPAPSIIALSTMKAKAAKETIKSSAEKPKLEEHTELDPLPRQQKRRLKSTFSATNLFAGQDILGQISEFCSEIKKFAVIRRNRHFKTGLDEKNSAVSSRTSSEKEVEKTVNSVQESCRMEDGGGGGGGGGDRLALLKQEVRSCPPSPQRIPSPMGPRNIKQNEISPLKKPLRPAALGRGILKELVQNKEDDETGEWTVVDTDEGCNFPAGSGSKTLDNMFWFLNPCRTTSEDR